MTTSIEYHVRYPYVEGRARPIITFYNGKESPNLHQKCNTDLQGQLYSKDLVVPLDRPFWCKSVNHYDEEMIWSCYGRTKIQHPEPKSYSFSLGFECDETNATLRGMQYEVTIYDVSNTTSCEDLQMISKYSDEEQQNLIDDCKPSYQYAAFPNQAGNSNLEEATAEMESLLNTTFKHADKECLSKLKPFLCKVLLPKCLPEENKILLPCRDTCKSI